MKPLTVKNLNQIKATQKAILSSLTDDLRYERFRGQHPMSGFCYVVAEACFHMFGKKLGFKPMFVKVGDVPHWFLERPGVDGCRRFTFDPCASQFWHDPGWDESWFKAKGKGFLTKEPSKRARILIERVKKVLKEQR